MRPRPLLIAALLSLCCTPAAASEAFNADVEEALQGLITDLDKLARWCKTPRLFGKRDEAYELVLEFDPDHERARKTLKFKRSKDGGWVQSPKYKRPRNWKPKVIPQYEERLAQALARYRDRMLDACIREAARGGHTRAADLQVELLKGHLPGDAKVLQALKKTLLEHHGQLQSVEVPIALERVAFRLNKYFPKDPDVRRALGEIEIDGRWVLPATVKALERHKQITVQAAAALKAVPAVSTAQATDAEMAAGGAGDGVKTTAHLRVLGTTSAESLASIAKHCEAAGPFIKAVLGREVKRAKMRTLFVFRKWDHWKNFVDRWKGFTPEVREYARAATSSGYPVGEHEYACLPVGRPEVELDVCADVIFQTLLNEAFAVWQEAKGQWHELPGWVRIGVSDYLTYRLTGKRILTTVGGEIGYGQKKPEIKYRSPKAGTDLLPIALEALQRNQAPGTHMMLGKGLAAFTKDDAITSFAFARYLLEGRPKDAVRILTEVGKGRDTKAVVKEVLNMSIEALHVELMRWIEEMIATAK